jgi:iron(III) transport system ATP-binding protein
MLELKGLKKSFGPQAVLCATDLRLETGGIGVLLGASGSGKTTLLRLIAGLEKPDAGSIFLDGAQMTADIPPSRRSVALMFQSFALFPHLCAKDNVAIALGTLEKSAQQKRADEVLELCGLIAEKEKFPHEMSGGQQQRLALARALAPRPRLLLMDEPFSSLDPELRVRLSLEVRSLLKSQGVTSLVVTHQIDEAYDLADRIGILNKGKVEQWSTPYDLYHMPESRFVAQYLDRVSFMRVHVENDGALVLGRHRFPAGADRRFEAGSEVHLLVRPDDIQHDDASPIKARVRARYFRGSWFLYELELEGARFFSYVPSHHNHHVGDEIGIVFDLEHLICFPS